MERHVGFVGWRGMVGSVLMERMREEGDFSFFRTSFFTTSQTGSPAPACPGESEPALLGAFDLEALGKCEILISCQGNAYTAKIYPRLRGAGWQGYWIDASSHLRMDDQSVIVLDPINRSQIQQALSSGKKLLVGGNCVTSLMLLGLAGLFQKNWVAWISNMTYQAASGAGAKHLEELIAQMRILGEGGANRPSGPLSIDRASREILSRKDFPQKTWGAPLAANCLPAIGEIVESGQSEEEGKVEREANKILTHPTSFIPIDGLCVRIGAIRAHSQALTVGLTEAIPLHEIEEAISAAHEWVELVPNTFEATNSSLTPVAVSGTLVVRVGRVRKMQLRENCLAAFVVGDQLLWGAAEPLRRALRLLLDYLSEKERSTASA